MKQVSDFFIGLLYDRTDNSEVKNQFLRLPDEITTLVLSYLPPMTCIATCPYVCKKWDTLLKRSFFWRDLAKEYKIAFAFKPEEEVTLAFKKQIYTSVRIGLPPKTKQELVDQIKKICSLMKFGEIIGIKYISAQNPDAYCKIHMIKIGLLPNFDWNKEWNKREEQINLFYQIHGEKEADFGAEEYKGFNGSSGLSGNGFDYDFKYKNTGLELSNLLQITLKTELTFKILNFFKRQ